MPKVRMLTSRADALGSTPAGAVLEVSAKEADAWIEAGIAEPSEAPPPGRTRGRRTAPPAGEQATAVPDGERAERTQED